MRTPRGARGFTRVHTGQGEDAVRTCGRDRSEPLNTGPWTRGHRTMRVVSLTLWTLRRSMEYLIREYPLQQGALEIAYIEEYFNEFPRRKTATDIVQRLEDRESQILMAEAPLADDPAVVVPVSYKVSHELQADETDPHLADLVARLRKVVTFRDRRILYNWLGANKRDWRSQGPF